MNITIRKPIDFHAHLREGVLLKTVLPFTVRHFSKAIVMPNLIKPVVTVKQAKAYRKQIMSLLPRRSLFEPMMTLYLTEKTDPAEVRLAKESAEIFAFKLYPAGATTNAASGVHDIRRVHRVLAMMEKLHMPLLIHGEVTDPEVDVFDREQVFIDRHLSQIIHRFPGLKVVLEHVTTKVGVDFVMSASNNVAATITPHHLTKTRTDLLGGSLDPHLFCKPILKSARDRDSLIRAATSGSPKFFAGTDTAPHVVSSKHSDCCPAGIFNAPTALATYAEVFATAGKLAKLNDFMSYHGAKFYNIEPSGESITLVHTPSKVPSSVKVGKESIRIFRGGESLRWSVTS